MLANHLTMQERERISQMHFAGFRDAQIARDLGRHRSTIGRELKRNRIDGEDTAIPAKQAAAERRCNRPHKLDRAE